MSAATSRPRATLADWTRLNEAGENVELIDGEIVRRDEMEVRPTHSRPQAKLAALLDPYNRRSGGPKGPGGWWLMTEASVLYLKTEEIYKHDLAGFRRDRHEALPDDDPMRIQPDWVCEILSKSTARNDLVRKHRTLHRHAVSHYWIIDPKNETLTVLRYHPDAYLVAQTGVVGDVVRAEPFEGIELSIAELLGHDE